MWFLLVIAVLVAAALLARGMARKAPARPRTARPGPDPLDEEAPRPDTDPAALARARAAVSRDVPDEVLADALLDASPTQLARAFAAVPAGVMAAAMSGGTGHTSDQARPADLAQLRGAGDAVDDLEIFNFGKND